MVTQIDFVFFSYYWKTRKSLNKTYYCINQIDNKFTSKSIRAVMNIENIEERWAGSPQNKRERQRKIKKKKRKFECQSTVLHYDLSLRNSSNKTPSCEHHFEPPFAGFFGHFGRRVQSCNHSTSKYFIAISKRQDKISHRRR